MNIKNVLNYKEIHFKYNNETKSFDLGEFNDVDEFYNCYFILDIPLNIRLELELKDIIIEIPQKRFESCVFCGFDSGSIEIDFSHCKFYNCGFFGFLPINFYYCMVKSSVLKEKTGIFSMSTFTRTTILNLHGTEFESSAFENCRFDIFHKCKIDKDSLFVRVNFDDVKIIDTEIEKINLRNCKNFDDGAE